MAFPPLETAVSRAFRGYGAFRRLLSPQHKWPELSLPQAENQLFEELRQLETKTLDELRRFEKIPLPRVFKFLPVWLLTVLLLLAFGAAAALLHNQGYTSDSYWKTGVALVAAWVVILVVHQLGKRQGAPSANTIAGNLARARRLHDDSLDRAELQYAQEQERIQKEFETTSRNLNQAWKQTQKEVLETRGSRAQKVDEKGARALLTNELSHRAMLKEIEERHADNLARLQQEADARSRDLAEVHAEKMVRLESEQQTRWQALETEWKSAIQPIHDRHPRRQHRRGRTFSRLGVARLEKLDAAAGIQKCGEIRAAGSGRGETGRGAAEGQTPGAARSRPIFPCRSLLTYPGQGSILFETAKTGGDEAVGAINNIIFRLLSTTPPGKLSFTIFDPVGLGQNFAALMHLADYEESHINSRIWTQSAQFEEKLAELNEHMEKIIQMYLRNEYATIAEYNAQAGSIAEKYHFLVIASISR